MRAVGLSAVLLLTAPSIVTAVPTNAVSSSTTMRPRLLGRRVQAPHEQLCEELRRQLPTSCIVGPECFGFVCLEDLFGTALSMEVDLAGVCDPAPEQHVSLALERPLRVSRTHEGGDSQAPGLFDREQWHVCRDQVGRDGGCYDLTVHQCDCGIPDAAATCQALNTPSQRPRFFWTPGCTSCAEQREWEFRFESTGPATNYSRRMSGLEYDVPSCANPDGAGGFIAGQFRSNGGIGNTLLSIGLDACCAYAASNRDDALASILVAAKIAGSEAPAATTGPSAESPDGCYEISVHRCDCGVPDQAVCNALNIPGGSQRFFWTAGCASCAGRDTCGPALDSGLPRMILDGWSYDWSDACGARAL